MNGVTVAYSGVHQAFQLALAASEMGKLDRFYCSMFDAPGKWGGLASKILGSDALINRRCREIPANSVREFPWPWIADSIVAKLRSPRGTDLFIANDNFDRWVSRRLVETGSSVFVGVETCAQHSFREAKRSGSICVLDCPQMHPTFLERVYREAGENLGISIPAIIDTDRMAARKSWEFQGADYLLAPSEPAKRSFIEAGFSDDKLVVTPLWVDINLWFPEARAPRKPRKKDDPLRVLFVGGLSWRKGIPYLIEAARSCGTDVRLTLVGSRMDELESYLAKNTDVFEWIGPQTKPALRRIYCEHDVFVLPSLADTFGFVALEAMACGLPVIVTDNCGAPVPDSSWRAPVMNAEAIACRLAFYAENRDALQEHGEIALNFSRQYTPSRYREQIKKFLGKITDG
jgi:glycosyltransferase involved in cell wall biosynthesis